MHKSSFIFILSVSGEYRYDKAEYFSIIIGNMDYQFRNAYGITDSNTVAFYLPDTNDTVVFNKNNKILAKISYIKTPSWGFYLFEGRLLSILCIFDLLF